MMTATPLQIVNTAKMGASANDTIIQWHGVAMFAPAFFTGKVITRFGEQIILRAGVLTYFLTIACALVGNKFWFYFASLALMGVGWIFL